MPLNLRSGRTMRTAIFDMDGLLIDSEPLWRSAEIAVFGSLGIRLTEDLCRQTMGLRIDEVVRYWHRQAPWNGPSREQVAEQVLDAVQCLIIEHGSLMEGARDTIADLYAQDAKLAIASSSPLHLIKTVVEKFAIDRYFSVLHSAEHEVAGKPNPAVYRTTMSLLEAEAQDCVAFEDSVLGVQAAKAAGATVVAVPAPEDALDPGFAVADVVLASLKDFSLDLVPRR